jgi:tetratricopeptide (TPR) repeat protein
MDKRKVMRGRWPGWLAVLSAAVILGACAAPATVPEDDREVDTRVREPAQQDSAGVQVFPLKNPAVEELVAQAHEAERAGRLDDAAVLLERAMRIQPRNPELLQHMAEVHLQKKDYEQALSFSVRSYDIGPRVGEICSRNWRTISVAREHLDDHKGASEAEHRAGRCMNTKPASY